MRDLRYQAPRLFGASISRTWDAQRPLLAIPFGDVHALDRPGLIRSISEFCRQFVQPLVASQLLDVVETLAVDPGHAAISQAADQGPLQRRLGDTPCRTGRKTGSPASSSLWCATPSATSRPSLEVVGACQSPGCLSLRALALN